tara:strand:- start:7367 stop:7546 length:180 start_codon:yes stop_codon:yes gene_type:complete
MENDELIAELFEKYKEENEKFETSGNKSAGTRARKLLSEIAKVCKLRRAEIQAKKTEAV